MPPVVLLLCYCAPGVNNAILGHSVCFMVFLYGNTVMKFK